MRRIEVKRLVRRSAWIAALSMFAGSAMAGGIGIGIHIDVPVPAPVVVVQEQPVTYDVYVTGYRRQLYDADLALRLARADEFAAYDQLQAARSHEAEVAARFDDNQAAITDLQHRIGAHGGDIAAIHADVLATSDRIADLHKQLDALDHRIASAHEDFDAAKILNDRRGMDSASDRIHENEDKSKAADADLHDAEARLDGLRAEEAAAAGFAADRDRLRIAQDSAVALQHDLDVAHDVTFTAQKRWEDARERVFVCMHDRDEALWLLHRDDIYAGRIDLATCGFSIDLAVWGGHLPRDPEVVHVYLVHDVGYWRANPVIIETRCTEVVRINEIVKIRDIVRVHDADRVHVLARVDAMKIEDRRHYAEVVVDEHKRFEAEAVERKTALAEHRAPRIAEFEHQAAVANHNAAAAHREAAVANHNAAVAQKETAVANHNAAAAEKTASRDKAEVKADDAKIAQQQKEIDKLKADDSSAAAGDSRAARARRRAADDQSSSSATDSKGSAASSSSDSPDSRAARARRRAADESADANNGTR